MRLVPVALTLVAMAALASPARAVNGVRVTVNGGGGILLAGPQVDAARDVPLDTRVTTRRADGSVVADGQGGTSLATLVQLAHIPPEFVQQVTIARVNAAGAVAVSGDEVRDGFSGDPAGSPRFATVYTGYGHGVHFFRPLRDDGDVNAGDVVDTPDDTDLAVDLRTTNAAVRQVVATVDAATLNPGQPGAFSVHVEGPPSGVAFSYSWDFGDGSGDGGQTPAHSFAAGHYRVIATAVGDDGSSGVSAPIEVQVGAPVLAPSVTPTAPVPTPAAAPVPGPGRPGGRPARGGGTGSEDAASSGPARSRGNGNASRGADGRAAPGPRADATPAPTRRRGPSATAAPERTPAAEPKAPPVRPAATATPAPSPAPTPVATPPAAATPTPAPSKPPAVPRRSPAPAPAEGANRVSGVLVADTVSVADVGRLLGEPPSPSARQAAARPGGDTGTMPWGWAGGGVLLVALLGLGALREGHVPLRARLRAARA